jgi:hypothetical protein
MIQVAAPTWQLCADRYPFQPREVEVKGIGTLRTYLLDPASMPKDVGAAVANATAV